MENKLGCIVLNYNDAESTINLLNHIIEYNVFDKIIVVDGKSTDNSAEIIEKEFLDKIVIIRAEKNGGYGYGNNIGIRYCIDNGFRYGLIANPDVLFSEKAIYHIYNKIQQYSNCVAISPQMHGREAAIKIEPTWKDIWASSIIINKLLRIRCYPKGAFSMGEIYEVDALPGSLVLFDLIKFRECGLYDENVFLYNEEVIIANKFRKKGYTSFLDTSNEYIHNHSVSVNKNYKSLVKARRIVMKSHYYYLKNYAGAGKLILMVFNAIKPIKYIEAIIWSMLRKLRIG